MMTAVIDVNLLVGPCPFRRIPSSAAEIERLRGEAGLERGIATGFRSLFYYDPLEGLREDMREYESLSEWLRFHAVVHPEFPAIGEQVRRCAADKRIAGLRFCPALHGCRFDSPRLIDAVQLAGRQGLPVSLMARLFDGRVAPIALQQGSVDLDQLRTFLLQTQEVKIVLSMFFFSELRECKLNWPQLPNVYVDVGCSKPEISSFDELPSWFPAQRAMLGAGAPLYYWRGSRLALEGARLTPEQKASILGGAAREVFRWG